MSPSWWHRDPHLPEGFVDELCNAHGVRHGDVGPEARGLRVGAIFVDKKV